jgi:serine/threonine-protein kinase
VRARFLGEAAALARLTHPNTVRVFDYGQSEGMTWLVMEYVEGRTLHHELRNAAFAPADAVEVVDQVCRSLEEAHQFGIVHRDLKPNNLILYADGTGEVFVKLMDFGIAKDMQDSSGITRQGALLGTPAYMAPEQVLGQAVDPRTDIYAMGVMLFRLFTGRTPYGDLTGHAVLIAHVQNTPYSFGESSPGLVMSPAIEWVVMRCLEKARSERIVDVAELRRGLRICRYALAHPDEEIPLALVNGRIQVDERIITESPAPGPIQHKLSTGAARAGGLPTPSSASLSGDGLSWGSTGGLRGSLSQHAPGSGPPPAPSGVVSPPPPQPAPPPPAATPPGRRAGWQAAAVASMSCG